MSANQALDTCSDAYRHECEARYVASMRVEEAEEFLVGVANKRGVEAADKLRFDSLIGRATKMEIKLKKNISSLLEDDLGPGHN